MEAGKEQHPPGLVWIDFSSHLRVLQNFVLSINEERMCGPPPANVDRANFIAKSLQSPTL